MTILYRYALDPSGQPVDVTSLQRDAFDREQEFSCADCKGVMVARLGEKNARHFAHKSLSPNCSGESYLHKTAVLLFYHEYRACLEQKRPFELVRTEPVVCDHYQAKYGYTCKRTETLRHDLTRFFDQVYRETKHGGLQPDILLRSTKTEDVLFVEIAVTHRCEPEKIAAGFRILEYTVKSESHIETIQRRELNTNDPRITLHNFRTPLKTKSICQGSCPENILVFVVFPSQKCKLFDLSPAHDISDQINARTTYIEVIGKAEGYVAEYFEDDPAFLDEDYYGVVDDPDISTLFRQKVRDVYFKKIPIRNCYMCRYHGGQGIESAVFCKIDKVPCSSNRAAGCDKYKPMRTLKECADKDRENDDYARGLVGRAMANRLIRGPDNK